MNFFFSYKMIFDDYFLINIKEFQRQYSTSRGLQTVQLVCGQPICDLAAT